MGLLNKHNKAESKPTKLLARWIKNKWTAQYKIRDPVTNIVESEPDIIEVFKNYNETLYLQPDLWTDSETIKKLMNYLKLPTTGEKK